MIGLYILISFALEYENKAFKFGMSMRLDKRWYDYSDSESDPRYHCIFKISNKLTDKQVKFLEGKILKKTDKYRKKTKGNEYRDTTKISYEDFIKIAEEVLKFYGINYKIEYEPPFEKPERMINENTGDIEEEELFKIDESQPITPPESPLCVKKDILKPYDIQLKQIIQPMIDYYNDNKIGQLIIPPGTGKTLCSLFFSKNQNYDKILIGVPNTLLLKQWKKEIKRVFPDIVVVIFNGSSDIEKIKSDILSNNKIIIITTYQSCNKLSDINIIWNFKIGDECHHLTGLYNEKCIRSYKVFIELMSDKTLYMTGTRKLVEHENKEKIVYSMDDEELFGKIIVEKPIIWSIDNKLITDYKVIILKNTENEIDCLMREYLINSENEKEKELFVAAIETVKCILDNKELKDLTHVLVYTNSIKNSKKVNEYIDKILDKFPDIKDDIYHKSLSSEDDVDLNIENENSEINTFIKSKYGIISCVYLFGEGVDIPKLNGVVYAENMLTETRIVQSSTRPMRKDKSFPDKIAYILIPYLIGNTSFINEENQSFQKLRKIIYHIGNQDTNIEQKMKLKDNYPISGLTLRKAFNIWKRLIKSEYIEKIHDVNENLLEMLKLKLKKRKYLDNNLDELYIEYLETIERNKMLNISSKSEYNSSIDKAEYVNDPENKFGLYWTNWYDFMGYDTSEFIQNKEEWIIECKKNNIKSLEDYKKICENNVKFPINPIEFYQHYTNFNNELNLNTQRRR